METWRSQAPPTAAAQMAESIKLGAEVASRSVAAALVIVAEEQAAQEAAQQRAEYAAAVKRKRENVNKRAVTPPPERIPRANRTFSDSYAPKRRTMGTSASPAPLRRPGRRLGREMLEALARIGGSAGDGGRGGIL
jgi:hypothetical protein